MSRLLDTYERVSRRRPCPICGKTDWCLVTKVNPATSAICARISEGSCKRIQNRRCDIIGYLHDFIGGPSTFRPRRTKTMRAKDFRNDWFDVVFRCAVTADDPKMWDFADELGVSPESLLKLKIGWSKPYGAWALPMENHKDQYVGVRLRSDDGEKRSMCGSREGLFIAFSPDSIPRHERLVIAEGATDTAALSDYGFNVVGRPSCTGGTDLIKRLIQRIGPSEVIVAADNDLPGRKGAATLVSRLSIFGPVKTIFPPEGTKDFREWRKLGAVSADIEGLISQASPSSVSIKRVA